MSGRAHGTRTKYVNDSCRCNPCTAANRTYAQRSHRARAYGRVDLHDAAKAREHLRLLRSHGLGLHAIAAAAGVNRKTLSKILSGETTRIRAATGRRIMAVALDAKLGGALVDAAPTWALINALVANGWTRRAIAYAAGLTSRPGDPLQVRRDRVTKRTADAIATLARERPNPPAWAALHPAEFDTAAGAEEEASSTMAQRSLFA